MYKYTLSQLQERAYAIAQSKGWWEQPREMGTLLALIHSEVSEALEACREGNPLSKKISGSLFEEELADIVIRVMDLAESEGVDLEKAIQEKLDYNEGRSYRHGKEF